MAGSHDDCSVLLRFAGSETDERCLFGVGNAVKVIESRVLVAQRKRKTDGVKRIEVSSNIRRAC